MRGAQYNKFKVIGKVGTKSQKCYFFSDVMSAMRKARRIKLFCTSVKVYMRDYSSPFDDIIPEYIEIAAIGVND